MENIVQIRLECLKLAVRSDLLPVEVVSRASEYEKFVLGNGDKDASDNRNPKRPGRPAGKTAPLQSVDKRSELTPESLDKSFDKTFIF